MGAGRTAAKMTLSVRYPRMPPAPELAKLSRPRIYRVSPRERLFRLLDERREHPVVWVSGAPGAGKSALVASYVDARKLAAIWYHVDSGDADPATYFYYLGLAGAGRGAKKAPGLPLFTDEYRRDLNGFARRWFRQFFARMPAGAVLVLDNLHEASGSSECRAAFATGLEEIPVGVNVVVISRSDPPPEFARLVASQTVARIAPAELRFTREEAARLLAGDGELDARTLDRVYDRSDGWAAGLILMREHAARSPAGADGEALATPEAVFAYFAGEIVGRIPAENQRLLMICALPPRITKRTAAALTGDPDAGKYLEYGYRRHLFVARRDANEPTYEFHGLFREFLLKRAAATFDAQTLAGHRRRAAELLEGEGVTDGVFELYRDAEQWGNAVRVTLADAPGMLAQGRFQSALERVAALPAAAREAEPWLAYWEGVARVNVDPLAARASLERAYNGFVARGDSAAQIQAVEALIVSHYLAWDDWRPVDRWIDVMEQLLARERTFASPDAEARALSSLAIALVYRQPGHPLLAEILARLTRLLDSVGDRNLQVAMATRLIDGLNKSGSFAESQRVAQRIRTLIDDPEVRPLTSAWSRIWLANLYYFQAKLDDFESTLSDALAIAESHGLAFFVPVIQLFRNWGLLARGDTKAAAPVIAHLAATVDPSRKLDLALLHFLQCWSGIERGDLAAAEREGRNAARLSLETGSVASTLICHTGLALALDQTGQQVAALGVLDRMQTLVAQVSGGMLRYHTALWEAWLRMRSGEGDWRAPLAAALALGAREGYLNHYLWWPPMMSRLAATAIAEGIEPDYVRQLVAARGLPPPADGSPRDWPWPLRIHALGRFEVVRDGAALAFRGKAAQGAGGARRRGRRGDARRGDPLAGCRGRCRESVVRQHALSLAQAPRAGRRARAHRGQARARSAPVLGRRVGVRACGPRGGRDPARCGGGGRARRDRGARAAAPGRLSRPLPCRRRGPAVAPRPARPAAFEGTPRGARARPLPRDRRALGGSDRALPARARARQSRRGSLSQPDGLLPRARAAVGCAAGLSALQGALVCGARRAARAGNGSGAADADGACRLTRRPPAALHGRKRGECRGEQAFRGGL